MSESVLSSEENLERFRPGEVWTDTAGVPINAHGGGILRHGATYYWFGEHKIAGPWGNEAHVGVRVYASEDLVRWRNQGIALAVSADPASEIASGCILERPKVIHNRHTGLFVMWFHLEPPGAGYTGARSGVAVANAPCGPYRYLGSLRPNAGIWPLNADAMLRQMLSAEEADSLAARRFSGGPEADFPADLIQRRDHEGGQMARDMTLFVDEDDIAYQIYSSEENGTLHISQLTKDYLHHEGRYIRVFPGGFNEAPALMKWSGRYFLFTSGCTGWRPNALRLAVADSIWGPWTDMGNPCVGTPQESATTFQSQPTFILPVNEKSGRFIFMADRWAPKNPIDGRYVWLPVDLSDSRPTVRWHKEWTISAS
ncbi:beta-glucanase [Nibricoccus aquaticus]|uniref:Beta-glucanase n=1 Tax=Nibricoccus aquaticus TaxID=2576891 RepID=A0A290QLR4_9BACT|nr:glycoside hydrolase family 43 protein [Nibricoccus aquaticus]ATC65431.1 beta-glucanase [Nibricoccus aquaticus]